MATDRRQFLAGLSGTAALTLAGCLGGTEQSESTEEPSAATNVGMVYATGGLGDGSFNDQAQQGVIEAEAAFDLAYDETQPSEASEFATFQRQFARSETPDYDLVCCIGFLQTDALAETAADFPDQQFMLVDSVAEGPNVTNYVFSEHEGSYLVGQMAGNLTGIDFSAGGGATRPEAATCGFVGGVESPLIGKFEAGFRAGVTAANPDAEVLTNYTGSFNDPAAGKEAALAMFDNGADIIYHASGNTGTGVFQAAQEQGRYAIGVDRDQSVTKSSFSDVILASMVKRVDTAVYSSIESVVQDTFEGGTTVPLGLEAEGVGAVYGQELGEALPAAATDAIDSARAAIIAGDVTVPTDPADL